MGARYWNDDQVYDDQLTIHERRDREAVSELVEGATPMGPNCSRCWYALIDGVCPHCGPDCPNCLRPTDETGFCVLCGRSVALRRESA